MTSPPLGKIWQADDGLHIDVRGLTEPPEPMVAIIRQLEDADGPVIIHHFCLPVYLFPELDELGWGYKVLTETDDEVQLLLQKNS